MLSLVLLLACSGPVQPEPDAERLALDAWRRGEELLERDPQAAEMAFAQALEHQPGDPVLRMWRAKALAESGDLEAALLILDAVLQTDPHDAEARYNRASYAARLGRLEQAADDLRLAIEAGVVSPRDAVADPDFAPHRADPRFGFLPLEALQVSVEAPVAGRFVGSDFTVRLRVMGAGDGPVSVTSEAWDGPVSLLRVIEDSNPSTSGPLRDIAYLLRVTGAGTIVLGPLQVWSGDRRATVPIIEVAALAPPNQPQAPTPFTTDLLTPDELRAGHQLSERWQTRTEQRAVHRDREAALSEGGVLYERRERGVTQWFLTRRPR